MGGVLAGDDSASFLSGWTVRHPFRPLQQRWIQLPADPSAASLIFSRKKNHTNLCSTTIPIAYIWKWQESRMPSPTLWAQKQGAGRRANTPARGAGTEMGTGMARKCIGATSSCTPPQRSRRLSSAGLEPVPVLGEELSRKYFTHRTQEMFSAAMLHAQPSIAVHYQDMLTWWEYSFIMCWKTGNTPVFTSQKMVYKRPEAFSCAPLFVCKLEQPPLWGRDSQQNPQVGPPHRQWYSLLQQYVLLSCIVIPGLGVGMCTEGNKTQKDFAERYKFLALG